MGSGHAKNNKCVTQTSPPALPCWEGAIGRIKHLTSSPLIRPVPYQSGVWPTFIASTRFLRVLQHFKRADYRVYLRYH